MIEWSEPDRVLEERRSDRALANAGFRAGAFSTALTACFLAGIAAIDRLPPPEIIAALAGMLLAVGIGPALLNRFARAARFELRTDRLAVHTSNGERYALYSDIKGYVVSGSIVTVQIESPDGWFRDARRLRSGLREIPLPEDLDTREAVLGRLAVELLESSVDPRARPQQSADRRVLKSYAGLVGLIIVSAPYAVGIAAALWFDSIPFNLGWRPWLFACWATMTLLGPGTFIVLARHRRQALDSDRLWKEALALNVLTVMFSTAWMYPASVLLLEWFGLPY